MNNFLTFSVTTPILVRTLLLHAFTKLAELGGRHACNLDKRKSPLESPPSFSRRCLFPITMLEAQPPSNAFFVQLFRRRRQRLRLAFAEVHRHHVLMGSAPEDESITNHGELGSSDDDSDSEEYIRTRRKRFPDQRGLKAVLLRPASSTWWQYLREPAARTTGTILHEEFRQKFRVPMDMFEDIVEQTRLARGSDGTLLFPDADNRKGDVVESITHWS